MTRLIAIITIALSLCWANELWAKRTTRSKLNPPETTVELAGAVKVEPGMITIDKYDKPLRSRYESMFVTNHTPATVTSVRVRLDYISMEGDTIHEAVRLLKCSLPPNSTRRLTFSSWDKQLTLYYYLTDKPSRLKGTPYKISIVPLEMTHEK